MYAEDYGTDWQRLSADEAIERAYALGVARTLGEQHEGELDRLRDAVGTAGDRALVQLAFDKGLSRGKTVRIEASDDDVWTAAVSSDELRPVFVPDPRDLPPALKRLPLLQGPGDGLDRIRLPKFLTRR